MQYIEIKKDGKLIERFVAFYDDKTDNAKLLNVTFDCYIVDKEFNTIADIVQWLHKNFGVERGEILFIPFDMGDVIDNYINKGEDNR